MSVKNTKVAIGLSGGVDSSLAAILLKEKGYDVFGLTMKIYNNDLDIEMDTSHACYGPDEQEDIEMAEKLCIQIEIPYHTIDLRHEYQKHVLKYFKQEYLAGRTPNPCIKCNQTMKFGFLLDKAQEQGLEFDYFATGHYARIDRTGDRPILKKARDRKKDQSYFLYKLPQQKLAEILFPLGDLTKQEVRKLAQKYNVQSAERAESQDFIAGKDYSVLFAEKNVKPGAIVDVEGNRLGTHKGLIHYTIGQRKGLGISHSEPLYVLGKDAENNKIIVTERENLFARGLIANNINMFKNIRRDTKYRAKAKIRKNQQEVDVNYRLIEDCLKVEFKNPMVAVTPGQSLVLYNDDLVIGGGIIKESRPLKTEPVNAIN
ncbi:MAG: tRNA 2-thiouridine(34) synthase MnmA [Candidatus Marinimicrobia bacterium]|nr:tRNA 2-thiouridine(34) synthase MnmA [Candidatus Neomarinimicrobiota bacterium]